MSIEQGGPSRSDVDERAREIRSPTGDPRTDAVVPALDRLISAVHMADERRSIVETEAALHEAIAAAGVAPACDDDGWRMLVILLACIAAPDVEPAIALGWRHDRPGLHRFMQSGVAGAAASRRIHRDTQRQLGRQTGTGRAGRPRTNREEN